MNKYVVLFFAGTLLATPVYGAENRDDSSRQEAATARGGMMMGMMGMMDHEHMMQMHQHMERMQELMAGIRQEQDPQRRRQLMREHGQSLMEGMRMMMGQGMTGTESGGEDGPDSSALPMDERMQRMQNRMQMMQEQQGMMQQMMGQMMEHFSRQFGQESDSGVTEEDN